MKTAAKAVRPAVFLALAMMVSGCGYALAGRASSLPDHIRVIGVPMFKNATPVFDIDRIITERVRTELIGRGKYRVQPDAAGVDALVDATIQSVLLSPATFDANRQASKYHITITASVTFRDLKTGKEIWANPSLSFRDEYQITNAASAADVTAFVGNESNAVTRLAADFARTVVSAMLEAF
jgi:hypothetical protein